MGRYQADPDNGEKSGPKALPKEAFGKITVPAPTTISQAPWYVLVNNTGSYDFLYETTASVNGKSRGGTIGEVYTSGIVVGSLGQGPIKLDINPVAWSGSIPHASSAGVQTGDVSFVYRGGL